METPNVNYVIRFTQEYSLKAPGYLTSYPKIVEPATIQFYPTLPTVDRAEDHRVA